MKTALGLAVAVLLAVPVLPSYSAAAQVTAGEYEAIRLGAMRCRKFYQLGELKQDAGDISPESAMKANQSCKSGVIKDAKATYSKLASKIKSESTKRALKAFQVALMTTIESGEPRNREEKSTYQIRLSALDMNVERAWQKLQLELLSKRA